MCDMGISRQIWVYPICNKGVLNGLADYTGGQYLQKIQVKHTGNHCGARSGCSLESGEQSDLGAYCLQQRR